VNINSLSGFVEFQVTNHFDDNKINQLSPLEKTLNLMDSIHKDIDNSARFDKIKLQADTANDNLGKLNEDVAILKASDDILTSFKDEIANIIKMKDTLARGNLTTSEIEILNKDISVLQNSMIEGMSKATYKDGNIFEQSVLSKVNYVGDFTKTDIKDLDSVEKLKDFSNMITQIQSDIDDKSFEVYGEATKQTFQVSILNSTVKLLDTSSNEKDYMDFFNPSGKLDIGKLTSNEDISNLYKNTFSNFNFNRIAGLLSY